jgi:hypothetical protein
MPETFRKTRLDRLEIAAMTRPSFGCVVYFVRDSQ